MRTVLACCAAALALIASPARADELTARVDDILRKAEIGGQRWSVYVERIDTGEPVYSHAADDARIPASNVKLFTTAAALDQLGPDFTVLTSVYAAGPIVDGTLHGDLVLYGRGDANISGRFTDTFPTTLVHRLARLVQSTGLQKIDGDVIGDGTYFEDRDFGPWKKKDEYRWYSARVNALSFNDNCADVLVVPTAGPRPAMLVEPATSAFQVIGAIKQVRGSRDDVMAWREGGRNVVGVGGSIGRDADPTGTSVALLDPAGYAATVFREALVAEGVPVSGSSRSVSRAHPYEYPKSTAEIARLQSQPLRAGLEVINSRSQNLHAELLTKTLGKVRGQDGSWAEGLAVMQNALCGLGVDMRRLTLVDGSGLGRKNRATARSIVSVLRVMANHPYAQVFEDSLIQVGVDPYLPDLAKSIHYGELYAKTGSLNGVVALSGYVRAPGGAPLAYSLLGEHSRTKGSQALKATRDALAYALVHAGPPA